jgi:hypothetical protein
MLGPGPEDDAELQLDPPEDDSEGFDYLEPSVSEE